MSNTNSSLIIYKKNCYTNDDAYERVITYCQKDLIGGYLLELPLTRDSVINQFQACENNSIYYIDSKLWHFVISISDLNNSRILQSLADQIAALFCPNYQVIYGIDLDPNHYHIHFVVNAYGYTSKVPPLDLEGFEHYTHLIAILLKEKFPTHTPKIYQKEIPYV